MKTTGVSPSACSSDEPERVVDRRADVAIGGGEQAGHADRPPQPALDDARHQAALPTRTPGAAGTSGRGAAAGPRAGAGAAAAPGAGPATMAPPPGTASARARMRRSSARSDEPNASAMPPNATAARRRASHAMPPRCARGGQRPAKEDRWGVEIPLTRAAPALSALRAASSAGGLFAQASGERLQQRPGDGGGVLHEALEVPRRHAEAAQLRVGGDGGRALVAVEQRHLAEVVARAQRADDAVADAHERLALDDDEEADAAASLDDDLLAGGERPLDQGLRQPPAVALRQLGEERDLLEGVDGRRFR